MRALPNERGHWYVGRSPLSGRVSRDDIAAATKTWPDPVDPVYTQGVAERARALHQETDYAVILNLPLGVIHVAQWLRGFENWLMDLVLDPEFSIYLLDTLLERWLAVSQRLVGAAGDNIDVIFFAEDVAFHNGPMVSPETYEKIIHPYQRRIFQALHDWSDAKILYHNCGSVTWQINDLIDMGVDALNPVQVTSHDMGDTASLKQRFGDRIAFWVQLIPGMSSRMARCRMSIMRSAVESMTWRRVVATCWPRCTTFRPTSCPRTSAPSGKRPMRYEHFAMQEEILGEFKGARSVRTGPPNHR